MGKLPDVGTVQYELGVKYAARRGLKHVEITYVIQAAGPDPERYIVSVGGIRRDGTLWKLSEEQVIGALRRNFSFFVTVNGKRYDVIVSKVNGREYIKTTADRYMPAQLLSLPACP